VRRGRFPKPVTIPNPSKVEKFGPEPRTNARSIFIELAEVEALRLVHIEGLSQEKAGREMGVSRGPYGKSLAEA
jgi:predicted DNA-binding protein (UPF0251 family)